MSANVYFSSKEYTMTCNHCCSADDIFDQRSADKQLRKYLKKGPRKTSKLLIEALQTHMNGHKSILDIGGGIGAVHLDLLSAGLTSATSIDASSAYVACSKEAADEKGHRDRVTYHQGDFIDFANDLQIHDIVALDKVICCYPHMQDLMRHTTDKANSLIGIVYPRNNLLGKILIAIGNLWMKLKKSDFRAFMHSNREVRGILENKGFERITHRTLYPWNIEVYRKNSVNG